MENRKIQYTKKVIHSALIELLQEKSINKITVKELCEKANVNRSTFYSHYDDIFDLSKKLEDRIIEDIIKISNIDDIYLENKTYVFVRILHTVKGKIEENSSLLLNSPRCFQEIIKSMSSIFFNEIKRNHPELTVNQISYIYSFVSMGCSQLILEWVKNGMAESPETIAEIMSRTLKGDYYF